MHRRQRGQILPLLALLSLVLFAFAALALDGGLAFSDRRIDQNLSDTPALAGAHQLDGVLTSGDVLNAFAQAQKYFVDGLNQLGIAGNCPAYSGPPINMAGSNSFSCAVGSYTATVYWPPVSVTTGDTQHMLEVQVLHNNTPSLLKAAGLGQVLNIGAHAVALNGTAVPAKTHAVWSTVSCSPNCSGSGNTLAIDGVGAAQVDDGKNGRDCNSTTAADIFSDEKIHAPGQVLNVNGLIHRNKLDNDSKTLLQWWGPAAEVQAPKDSPPLYQPPPTDPTVYQTVYGDPDPTAVPTGSLPNITLTFAPGHYVHDVTIGPSGNVTYGSNSWSGVSDVVFRNGIYFFDNHSLTFNAGSTGPEAHSWDYQFGSGRWTATFPGTTDPAPPIGSTDPDTDRTTDGVEFYMNGSGYFRALGGMVNLQAPSVIDQRIYKAAPGGTTNFITVFIDKDDTANLGGFTNWPGSNVNSVLTIGQDLVPYGGAPSNYFHEQGVVYVAWNGVTPKTSGAIIEPSSLDYRQYAVQGQFVAPYVGISQGNVTGATPYTSCHDDTSTPTSGAAKIVQYDSRFVPTKTFGAGAQLYQ